MMPSVPNPIEPFVQTQLAVSRQYASTMLASAAQATHLVLTTTQRVATEQLKLTQSLADIPSPGKGALAQPGPGATTAEPSLRVQNDALRIMTAMQNEFAKSITQIMGQGMQQSVGTVKQFTDAQGKQAQATHNQLPNSMPNLVDIWATAYRGLTQIAAGNMGDGQAASGKITAGMHARKLDHRISPVRDRRISKVRDRRTPHGGGKAPGRRRSSA
ncbi:MAG: hypothetical protein JWQ23_4398 [Herminiimonas sp.]|nr:hypothetical protein [Herminiimonas sp.]